MAALACCPGVAGAYQWEATGGYSASDEEITEARHWDAALTWWSRPVRQDDGPRREAGFLAGISSASLTFQDAESTIDFRSIAPGPIVVGPTRQTTDTRSASAEYRHVWHHQWITSIGYRRGEADTSPGSDSVTDSESFQAGLGYYLTPSTTLQVVYREEIADTDGAPNPCAGPVSPLFCVWVDAHIRVDTKSHEVSVRHVGSMGRGHFAVQAGYANTRAELNAKITTTFYPGLSGGILGPIRPGGGEVTVSRSRFSQRLDDTERYTLSATLYPHPDHGLTLLLARNAADGADADSYGIGYSWFMTHAFELEASVTRTEPDGLFADARIDQFGLRARLRF